MEFEAPSVWRIASKHTVTFHNLAALGLKRLAAILVDLAEVDAETPTGTRRRLGQSLEKPWLSGAELKVRIQLPPAVSQQTFGSSQDGARCSIACDWRLFTSANSMPDMRQNFLWPVDDSRQTSSHHVEPLEGLLPAGREPGDRSRSGSPGPPPTHRRSVPVTTMSVSWLPQR
jgi:hypothetical protein